MNQCALDTILRDAYPAAVLLPDLVDATGQDADALLPYLARHERAVFRREYGGVIFRIVGYYFRG